MPEPADDQPYLAMKTVMMPSDTNPHGTIFAGVILSRMAMAGIIGARHAVCRSGLAQAAAGGARHAAGRVLRASQVGDIVSYWTARLKIGTTSITLQIQAETERGGESILLAEAEATYVAVEGAEEPRRPVPIRGN